MVVYIHIKNGMFNYKKTVQMLNFFAKEAEAFGVRLYKTNALKLVYLADKKHLRDYLRTISGDSYMVKQMGPVANSVCDLIEAQARNEEEKSEDIQCANEFLSSKKYMFNNAISITSKKEVDKKYLSETDMLVLNFVWDAYKDFLRSNDKQLWEETHRYPEGKKFEESNKWEKMEEKEMISTTIDGKEDKLGAISPDALKNAQEIYAEKFTGIKALTG